MRDSGSPAPVGVKFLSSPSEAWASLPVFQGTSYCQAVSQAGSAAGDGGLLVLGSSIGTCRWSPIVLGLKQPDSGFERRLEPHRGPSWGVALAPLATYEEAGIEPDIVILRGAPQDLVPRLEDLGRDNCAADNLEQTDRTALGLIWGGFSGWKARVIRVVNGSLAFLNKVPLWQRSTEILFRSTLISDLFDRLIRTCMADMSICRNSTVIPSITGKANLSYFCTGGVAWGENKPDHMTCGIPWELYRQLR